MDYIAYRHKDRKSDFGVSFPDFPGCITAGRTLEEARRRAAEALGLPRRCPNRSPGAVFGFWLQEPRRGFDVHHLIPFLS
jgi:hypothetical protein